MQFSSIGDLLAQRAAQMPDMPAFYFLEQRGRVSTPLTYGALAQGAGQLAAGLRARLPAGSVVACVLAPGRDFLVAFFGCLWAGMIATPVAPPSPGKHLDGLRYVIRQSRTSLVLADESARKTVAEGGYDTRRWVTLAEILDQGAVVSGPVLGQRVAYLQYTSGSTGHPKAIQITHANALDNSEQIRRRFGHHSNSIGVIWLPPYHDMGLIGGILQPLYSAFPVHLMSPQEFIRSPYTWLDAISRLRATTSGGPNFAYQACIDRISEERRQGLDLSSWDLAFTGAEPISASTLENFAQTFEFAGFKRSSFYPCYGLGEATLMVSGGRKGSGAAAVTLPSLRSGAPTISCGFAVDDHELIVVEPTRRQRLASGSIGEIWVRGRSVSPGYWRNQASTRRAFQAYLSDGTGPYLRTGDLGLLQDDEIIVCGRLKAAIIVRGVNHQLEDVERTVSMSHPALAGFQCAACVVGAKGTEELAILQELPKPKQEVSEIADAIRANLVARHGISPSIIEFFRVGRLPRTTSGKIRRHEAVKLVDPGGTTKASVSIVSTEY